jgi:hypothetical protein
MSVPDPVKKAVAEGDLHATQTSRQIIHCVVLLCNAYVIVYFLGLSTDMQMTHCNMYQFSLFLFS